ncbi:2,3-bisphosphoglycerate-independent phosphoglycerate mutase [Helicobacter sp. faydin-H20]|uniref:2,3-bisphosphoglycerate-independent phosphoglycerate mutase n=1 Tax=Helicobacter anatolicus TaxID=2905874 RepID=UPI001E57AE8B|nr:2,3-bisphosphoglycerate-independent phosphoglycerate mutase [Helicobacter anatolicus]MCE3036886.1 2,3-bisphosphoglycerate-independent phosphoglycerate mutase [Helicobacter anatolicus]
MSQKTILIITDGIGHNPDHNYNAFANAKKPTYDWLFENIPHSLIHTYGEHVGLPDGQMGNSEVGHMSLGSGQIIYQDLVKINRSIQENTLKDNKILQNFLQKNKRIHLCGLLSNGGVHSHIEHFIALLKIAQSYQKQIFLHLISDGRDVLPQTLKTFIKQILPFCNQNTTIATLSGRFYAMDRDKRWERINQAYQTIANGKNSTKLPILDYIEQSYHQEIYDEFIIPASFHDYTGFKDGDGFLFSNFRSDRAREIIEAIDKKAPINSLNPAKIDIVTMTEYDKNFTYPILFSKENIANCLAKIIAEHQLTQAHVAETEKYAHVTFFFNGGIEEPFMGETRALIASPKVKTYDLQPEMSAKEVGDAVLNFIKQKVDFIVVNFANGDMVGHTGNYEASIKAVEAVDKELGRIFKEAKDKDYAIILTSDHGNCEKMQDSNGKILTNHTVGDVWCFVFAEGIKTLQNGNLSNIAPSVLKIMGLPIPKEMHPPLF